MALPTRVKLSKIYDRPIRMKRMSRRSAMWRVQGIPMMLCRNANWGWGFAHTYNPGGALSDEQLQEFRRQPKQVKDAFRQLCDKNFRTRRMAVAAAEKILAGEGQQPTDALGDLINR